MTFTDEIILRIKAGKGGDGVVKWRRNRREQKGGPAGGNGGKGGDVYITGVRDIEYLRNYTSDPNFKAEDGQSGGGNSLEGKDGENLYIKVPIGSLVTNMSTGEQYDIKKVGSPIKILKGGKGGYGNEHFKSSRNVTPMESTSGKFGEVANFKVELRLIADAGFVGYPNAGKSTLLNTLTNSKVKTGNYDFTTINPNLGVLNGYVLADIPGLIKGASKGKGLGDRFLKHIIRTKSLIHCISAERDDFIEAYRVIRMELEQYDPTLLDKKELVVITKTDVTDQNMLSEKIHKLTKYLNQKPIEVSIKDSTSIDSLKEAILTMLNDIN